LTYQEESIVAVIESRALEFVLDLFRIPRAKFPARVLTTGATASNVMGMGMFILFPFLFQ